MLYANDATGNKIMAAPKQTATCPSCGTIVTSKCGSILIWHWSHKKLTECDSWSEGETEWHLNWKRLLPKENVEVKMENHRADMYINGTVIELQHSPISTAEIINRELFYKDMVWVIDSRKLITEDCVFGSENRFDINAPHTNDFCDEGIITYWTFRWKHPKKSFFSATKPIYLDFGNQRLFLIKRLYPNVPCRGWGYLISQSQFFNQIKSKLVNNGISRNTTA